MATANGVANGTNPGAGDVGTATAAASAAAATTVAAGASSITGAAATDTATTMSAATDTATTQDTEAAATGIIQTEPIATRAVPVEASSKDPAQDVSKVLPKATRGKKSSAPQMKAADILSVFQIFDADTGLYESVRKMGGDKGKYKGTTTVQVWNVIAERFLAQKRKKDGPSYDKNWDHLTGQKLRSRWENGKKLWRHAKELTIESGITPEEEVMRRDRACNHYELWNSMYEKQHTEDPPYLMTVGVSNKTDNTTSLNGRGLRTNIDNSDDDTKESSSDEDSASGSASDTEKSQARRRSEEKQKNLVRRNSSTPPKKKKKVETKATRRSNFADPRPKSNIDSFDLESVQTSFQSSKREENERFMIFMAQQEARREERESRERLERELREEKREAQREKREEKREAEREKREAQQRTEFLALIAALKGK